MLPQLPDPSALIEVQCPLERIDWEHACEVGKRLDAEKIQNFFSRSRDVWDQYRRAEQLAGQSRQMLATRLGHIFKFCRDALETPDLTAAAATMLGLNPTKASVRNPFFLPLRVGFPAISESRASDYAAGMFYAHLSDFGVEEFIRYVAGPGGGIDKLTKLERERLKLMKGSAPSRKRAANLKEDLDEIRKATTTPIADIAVKPPTASHSPWSDSSMVRLSYTDSTKTRRKSLMPSKG